MSLFFILLFYVQPKARTSSEESMAGEDDRTKKPCSLHAPSPLMRTSSGTHVRTTPNPQSSRHSGELRCFYSEGERTRRRAGCKCVFLQCVFFICSLFNFGAAVSLCSNECLNLCSAQTLRRYRTSLRIEPTRFPLNFLQKTSEDENQR